MTLDVKHQWRNRVYIGQHLLVFGRNAHLEVKTQKPEKLYESFVLPILGVTIFSHAAQTWVENRLGFNA